MGKKQLKTVGERIAEVLKKGQVPFGSNDAIGNHITKSDIVGLKTEAENAVRDLMRALVIDIDNDPHSIDTPKRVAQMYFDEVFAGRYEPEPFVTSFPNRRKLDELLTLGPIAIRSACSHHMCPVVGTLWCGVIPDGKVIGISKFVRIARHIMARPQIQEEAIIQLADRLEHLVEPRGLGVVMKAKHFCLTWRGVREHETTMTTNVMRGILKESPSARAEFMQTIAAQGFK